MSLYKVNTKTLWFAFMQAIVFCTNAQNLVYNGDFEIYSVCPNTDGQINRATGWFVIGGTPDYYNVCAEFGSPALGIPSNFSGYQQDCCGGGGYAGGYLMCSYSVPGDDSCREYMGTKLIDTLKVGHKYVASMYINRANYNYSIATIGMLFTDTAIVLPNPVYGHLLHANPQVKNTIPLTDTANWVLVRDTFIAVSHEAYLTIGNFNTTATSDTVMSSGSNWWYYGSAYYYIDGVSVYDVATLGINTIESKQQSVNLYPNPNNGSMMLDYTIKDDARLEMTDITGNLVATYNLPATGTTLQIQNNNLQSGMYLYRVISNNAVIKQGKIVIMK